MFSILIASRSGCSFEMSSRTVSITVCGIEMCIRDSFQTAAAVAFFELVFSDSTMRSTRGCAVDITSPMLYCFEHSLIGFIVSSADLAAAHKMRTVEL